MKRFRISCRIEFCAPSAIYWGQVSKTLLVKILTFELKYFLKKFYLLFQNYTKLTAQSGLARVVYLMKKMRHNLSLEIKLHLKYKSLIIRCRY